MRQTARTAARMERARRTAQAKRTAQARSATETWRAEEGFESFARALVDRVGNRDGARAGIDGQLARLRSVLVDGAAARAQACAGILQGWRALFDAGTVAAAPFAWLSVEDVALGPQREHREFLRRLQQHATDLEKAFDHFSALLAPLPAEAFAKFAALARERTRAGRPFESLRAVYEAWMECSDAAYAALAHTPAFGLAQSALSDAFLALRAQQQALLERAARQFDLPTRSELDSLHRQLRALRREVASLRTPKVSTGRATRVTGKHAAAPLRPGRRGRGGRPA